MSRIQHRFEFPDRFVAGTVGEPGQRTFFVQARKDAQLVAVVCEKQQVEVLADHLERILDELTSLVKGSLVVPPARRVALDLEPLDAPLSEDFRVGTMTLAWDERLQAIQVELFSVEQDESGPDLPVDDLPGGMESFDGLDEVLAAAESLSVAITLDQARDFTARARGLVHAGRPACPLCAQPVDASGHICPRANGYRRPLFA
ncbi:DUF3090 domain-containing protein [Luteococcus sp.]|uniref:DUF3090 domain-containing protein n=1 Tax=Luteococcus sp. TaxID=1969402 RepID=UPI003734C8E9